jgi:glycosyltransferase involved in cell wall biosynthesis
MANPLFSVIIATWNREHVLPRALESLARQTCENWEAIVVDDGSTDATRSAVAPWLRDARFRFLARDHEGISGARNAGLAAARGSWTTFLDSDDAYAPDHLAARRELIERHPGVRFFHGGFRLVGPPETAFVADARDPSRLIPLSDCAIGGTFVVETRYLRELGGFPDVPYAMDFALLNLALDRGPVVKCEHPTYIYIREPGQGECEMRRPEKD